MIGNFLIYLIESTICFSLMYMFYMYALYKTSYFVWSRWYMLFAVFISMAIPLVSFPYSLSDNYISNNFLFLNTYSGYGVTMFKQPSNNSLNNLYGVLKNSHFNLANILFAVYISGFVRYLIVSARSYIKILSTVQHAGSQSFGGYKLVPVSDKYAIYSWFKYIFFNAQYQNLSEKEISHAIEHEKVHIAQCHSCDILLYEIFGIFFWFNPLVKKSKQTVKNIHEFIVDSIMLKTIDAKEYSDLLIKLSNIQDSLPIVNHLAKNPILDRIWLMVFPDAEKLRKIRFISGMPLMILSIMFYSFVISEINDATNSLQINKNHKFIMPVTGNFNIASPFFIKKQVENNAQKNSNYKVLISHPEISISTESYVEIVASRNGVVKSIEIEDNWGVKEISIEISHNEDLTTIYKGLKYNKVKQNDTVAQFQVIGITGDNRLYPTISFQLLENNKPIDPMKYLNK